MKRNTKEKLFRRTIKKGCWLWTGAVTPYGYGLIGYHGKLWYVHRLSYFLTNGDIPEGKSPNIFG